MSITTEESTETGYFNRDPVNCGPGSVDVKLITAIVRPHLASSMRDALALFGVRGITVTPVYHAGNGPRRVEVYRGQHYCNDLQPMFRIELLVDSSEVSDLVRVIEHVAPTSEKSGGEVWVTDTYPS